MRLVLELAGHTVSTAGTGQEALERAERDKPDTVLLDLGLPDQNGQQVSAALRAKPHAPRIVITSGRSFQTSDAAALGADEILQKPFEPESLLAALRPKSH